jgi:hypothetical protein
METYLLLNSLQIFSIHVGCLFTVDYFCSRKVLVRCNLITFLIFAFVACAFWVMLKKILVETIPGMGGGGGNKEK